MDNHHNALACPYCNPRGLMLVPSSVLTEWAAARAYLDLPETSPLVDGIGRAIMRAREKGIASTFRCSICGQFKPGHCTSAADMCECPTEVEKGDSAGSA